MPAAHRRARPFDPPPTRRRRGAVVSVRVAGRPVAAMVADMIEGVVVANALVAPHADRVRAELWEAVQDSNTQVAGAA